MFQKQNDEQACIVELTHLQELLKIEGQSELMPYAKYKVSEISSTQMSSTTGPILILPRMRPPIFRIAINLVW